MLVSGKLRHPEAAADVGPAGRRAKKQGKDWW